MINTSATDWKSPDMPVILRDNEIHIWIAYIENLIHDKDYYYTLLSSDEKERTSRFHFELDKNRNIISCAILRLLISNYTDIKPEQIKYNYNKFKKPEIAEENNQKVRFNLSHSGYYIIYAFSLNREIGIDIEKNRQMNDADSIIRRFCSESEKLEYFSY